MEAIKKIVLPYHPRRWQRLAFSDKHRDRFNIRLCHRGAGKTKGICEYVFRSCITKPGTVMAIAFPEYRMAIRTFWREMIDFTSGFDSNIVIGNRQDFVWHFPQSKSSAWIISMSDPEAQRGLHLKGDGGCLVIDEAQDIDTEDFRRVLYPMVHNAYIANPNAGSVFILGTAKYDNNLLFDAWKWAEEGKKGWAKQRWSVYDTELYTDEYIEEHIKSTHSDEEFQQEYLCNFVTSTESLLIKSFSEENISSTIEVPEKAPIYVGMDFNVSPMTAVLLHRYDKNHFFSFDEIVLQNSNTEEMCQEIVNRHHGRQIRVFPDQSGRNRHTSSPVGQTDLTILNKAGFQVYYTPAGNPKRIPSFRQLNRMFCDAAGYRRLHIHPRCQHLLKGIRTVRYKPNSSIVDTSNPYHHIMDALRYAVTPYAPDAAAGQVRDMEMVI